MSHRGGSYVKNLSGALGYRSFLPNPLPPEPPIALSNQLVTQLVEARGKLAVLQDLTGRIPNMDLFVSMYVRKEALMSSQMEGTQATLEDVLDPMLPANANRDVAEVINYVKATEFGLKRRLELPLCNRLLREMHRILLEGVRGEKKTPGEFRTSQNWIGGQGSTLKNATYIPPNVSDMEEAMADLEGYIHQEDGLDPLIRGALIHYQFETIHPFLDGNGRIGRLLITLFLMEQGVLTSPALYISYYLKKNRIEYYDRMMEVRNKGNFEQWVSFFLSAVAESAEDAIHAVNRLSALQEENLQRIQQMGRGGKNAAVLFHYLQQNPIIEIQKTATALSLSFNTVSSAVNRLVEANILVQMGEGQRNRIFCYEAYLDILRQGTEI